MTGQNLWLEGFRLCTAEIVYETCGEPTKYNKVIWQELDHAPDFPVLNSFLRAWQEQDGVTFHSVQVAASESVTIGELRQASISTLVH